MMDPETVIVGMFVLGVCALLEFASHIDPATGHWVAGKGVLAWLRAARSTLASLATAVGQPVRRECHEPRYETARGDFENSNRLSSGKAGAWVVHNGRRQGTRR